jgi:23S rRNA G2445 N2-methylase RlmL
MGFGKNFSMNNASGERKESDLYETPYSMTMQLMERIEISGSLLEPAKGNGAICKILDEHGIKYHSYDKETNFLKENNHYDYIITNPPYSLAYEFIQKAKKVSDIFIFLLPLSYLHGKERYDNVWTDKSFPLRKIFVFTRYPMLGDKLREDGKYRTGMQVYAWYVWDRNYKGSPIIDWIDNQEFVLKRGE